MPPSFRGFTTFAPQSGRIIESGCQASPPRQASEIVMTSRTIQFVSDETGAVTVDFVVLTAGVIGLCMLFILPVLAESVNWGEAIAVLAQRSLGD
jgi:hypothetical protein